MATCYQHTADGYFAGEVEDYGLLPNNATYTAPPEKPWERVWPRWTGEAWELVEDHRERVEPYFPVEFAQDATPFWIADDTWQSPSRTMQEPGPLPEGHRLTRPQKPLAVAQVEKRRAIDAGYDAARVAAITMPSATPTPNTVALETSLLLAVDPDAVDSITAALDARRVDLLALVASVTVPPVGDTANIEEQDAAIAAAVAQVEAITLSYPV